MQTLVDVYKTSGHLHHAYIIEGHRIDVHPQLCDFCEKELDVKVRGNPDFIFEEKEKFIVADARRLRDLQLNKTKAGARQIFIVAFSFITREAQNALLKVLEEPTERTHIFLITPTLHVFLPTVLSRVEVVSDPLDASRDKQDKDAKSFLKASSAERLKKVANLVKDIKDEKASKADAIALVKDIEKELHREAVKKKDMHAFKKIEQLEQITNYLHDQGASTKMLLEQAALIV